MSESKADIIRERDEMWFAFFRAGVRYGWPDDRPEDEAGNWEKWTLRLYGEEAGDWLEGEDAVRHLDRIFAGGDFPS